MIRAILQLSKWNRKKCWFDLFWMKYSKYKMTYPTNLRTKNMVLKMYQILIALSTYVIFYENVEISMQVSNRQFFHWNDVFSRNYFWLGYASCKHLFCGLISFVDSVNDCVYNRSQKDCNTFFSMGFGMQLTHRMIVLIYRSMNKYQSFGEQTTSVASCIRHRFIK